MHRSKQRLYSINLSAATSRPGGTVRPSALAVLRLMLSSYFRRRLHRQVYRLSAFEDAINVGDGLPYHGIICVRIGDQRAAFHRTGNRIKGGLKSAACAMI